MSLPHHWVQHHDTPEQTALSCAILIARRSKGWSQRELASMLNIDYKHLSKIENARITPDQELLQRLSKLFGWKIVGESDYQ